MNNYVKSVFFAVIIVLIAWDIASGFAPQGTVTIHKGNSASFIQQESNLQTYNQNVPSSIPNQPVSNKDGAQQSNTQIQNSGSRDYVNPNFNRGVATSTVRNTPVNNEGGVRNPNNPAVQPKVQQSNTQIHNSGSRDYVNPNFNRGVATSTVRNTPVNSEGGVRNPNNPAVQPKVQQPNTQLHNSGSRDYVNPNFNRGVATSTVRNTPVNSEGGVRNPNNPAVQPKVQQSNTQIHNSGSRDYVNPNFNRGVNPTSTPKVNQNQQQKPRPDFPGLPSQPLANPQSPPQISYANKVIGGVTTKSPIPTTKASSGPSTSPTPTTEKPDEGPTDPELREFSEALLRRDVNNAAKYVTVNYQGKTTSQSQNDEAPQKLLDVKSDAFQIPTISKLKLLHNNYILDTNQNEHITAQEKSEENELLDAILTTPVMQFTKNFLISKGKISKDPKDFKDLLKILWFNMYSRGGGRIGSSGFEHIFLAELKKNEVSGLHNWVYFDQAELNKIVDYLGYMKKIDLGEKGAILKFHFKLNGVDKPVDSMFIGTSPEFEIALYTTCYLFRADRVCPLRLNGNNFIIRTYNFRYRGKNMIGSAFPEI